MLQTSNENIAVLSLSTIMALRMLGLFMVLPILSLYVNQLEGATPVLIGLAIGGYGITQALLQIPFGALSDRIGRKKIIILGLLIFALGSVIAATSHTIWGMILGRALQGAGAIGSTLLAMIADLTHETERTKAMAIAGITIGFSFLLAMLLGPLLNAWINISGIFWLAALFSMLAILILLVIVPTPTQPFWHADTEPKLLQFFTLLKDLPLMRLNVGIFLLHAIFTASFVVIPISLQSYANLSGNQQWMLYVPVLLLTLLLTLLIIIVAEKKQQTKLFFLGAISTLGMAEFLLWTWPQQILIFALGLLLFFIAFSVLEAFLPAMVSKAAPAARKGTALGIYSCAQFLGIFAGGALGGWLYGVFGLIHVYLFCITLTILWLAIAFFIKSPQHREINSIA